MSHGKSTGLWPGVERLLNGSSWHKADVQRLTGSGPLTGALPTFGGAMSIVEASAIRDAGALLGASAA